MPINEINTRNVPTKYHILNVTLSKKLLVAVPKGIVNDIPNCVKSGPSKTMLFAYQKSDIHAPIIAFIDKNNNVLLFGSSNVSSPV